MKNDWNTTNIQARIEVTWAFSKYVEDHPKEVPKLKRSPKLVRRLFADLGDFYLQEDPDRPEDVEGIPEDAKFRVFDFDPEFQSAEGKDYLERDNLIAIVLPRYGQAEAVKRSGDAREVWRCSYPPWLGVTDP